MVIKRCKIRLKLHLNFFFASARRSASFPFCSVRQSNSLQPHFLVIKAGQRAQDRVKLPFLDSPRRSLRICSSLRKSLPPFLLFSFSFSFSFSWLGHLQIILISSFHTFLLHFLSCLMLISAGAELGVVLVVQTWFKLKICEYRLMRLSFILCNACWMSLKVNRNMGFKPFFSLSYSQSLWYLILPD